MELESYLSNEINKVKCRASARVTSFPSVTSSAQGSTLLQLADSQRTNGTTSFVARTTSYFLLREDTSLDLVVSTKRKAREVYNTLPTHSCGSALQSLRSPKQHKIGFESLPTSSREPSYNLPRIQVSVWGCQ